MKFSNCSVFIILCLFSRHFANFLFHEYLSSILIWYYISSNFLGFVSVSRTSYSTLYFLSTFNISLMNLANISFFPFSFYI